MVNSNEHDGRYDNTPSSKRSLEALQEDKPPGSNSRAKRSRVSRACDQCRSSREKCDGTQPRCQTCTSQNRSCSYNEQPKKRGIQPNYIRTLELTLAWVFQSFPAAEDRLSRCLPEDNDSARNLISGNASNASEALHSAWRNSLVNRQIDQMLSGAPIELNGPKIADTSTADIEQVAAEQVATQRYNLPPPPAPSEQNGFQDRLDNAQAAQAAEGSSGGIAIPSANPSETFHKLPENVWVLLDYYFAFTHAWLPMVEKGDILRTIYSYPTTGLPYSQMRGAEHAELWSLLALAGTQVKPDGEDILRLRRVAESLTPKGEVSYEIPHIKSMMLLALIDIQDNQMLSAWLQIGSVVRLLHLFKLLENLGKGEKWCRHMHLAAFVVESALARRLRTEGHFRATYVQKVGFVDEDGLDEWAPWFDPLEQTRPELHAKTPARSFSTLNGLVQMYLEPVEGVSDVDASITGMSQSIVFDLLENASLKRSRVQPALLVANARQHGQTERPGSSATWNSTDIMHTSPRQFNGAPDIQQNHSFMSMPTEQGNFVENRQTQYLPTNAEIDVLPQPTVSSSAGNPPADIFEELAMLERQDSTHQPQFMQNLGFAPDFDLAEFFGTDYQPSDPLLAFLQPEHIGTQVNNSNDDFG